MCNLALTHLHPVEDPADQVFDNGVTNMNEFLQRVKDFEKITN